MKKLIGRDLANSVESVGSMLLFLIFAVCSLIMISSGAATYSRITEGFRSSFNSSSAVRYITNKIRSGDKVEIRRNGKELSVYNGETVCIIVSDGRGISEKNERVNAPEDDLYGSVIFPETEFTVSEENGVFLISSSCGKDTNTGYCRSRG